jgi:hypothetical protein
MSIPTRLQGARGASVEKPLRLRKGPECTVIPNKGTVAKQDIRTRVDL